MQPVQTVPNCKLTCKANLWKKKVRANLLPVNYKKDLVLNQLESVLFLLRGPLYYTKPVMENFSPKEHR